MNFQVDVKEFSRAIKPAVEVATVNTIKEFRYENLLTLKVEKNRIIIFAYGGTCSLITPISGSNFSDIDYKCEEEGQVTIYAKDLSTFLSSVPYAKAILSLESGQLKINSTKKATKKTARSMPTVSEVVEPPNIGKEFVDNIELDREVFVKGMDSVLFAPAFEEKMYTYMCMLFEAFEEGKKQILRFSAGTGGRFAIKSISGKNIILKGEKTKMIFPNANLNTIFKILSDASKPSITIKYVELNSKDNIPKQIMIEFDEMTMCIFGLEHFTKYPNLTKIINHQYSNRIYSNLGDWQFVVKSIEGTKNRYAENIHNTEIIFEPEEEAFIVTPRTAYANPTIVNIVDNKKCIIKGESIWFRCNSDYLREMVVQGGKTGKIQLNFESQAILDTIPDDKPKQMHPVLIKFEEDIDKAKEITENFHMFFTVSTK